MKRLGFLVVLLLALAVSTSVFAKTKFAQRGKLTVSGSVGLVADSSKPGEPDDAEWTTLTTLTLSPTIGYFVIDGLLVGGTPTIGYVVPEEGDNTFVYGLAPMVAYYANIMGTMFLGGGGALIFQGTSTGDNSTRDLGVRVFGGPTLAFGNKFGGFVSLYAFLTYLSCTSTVDLGIPGKGTEDIDSSEMDVGLLAEFGVYF